MSEETVESEDSEDQTSTTDDKSGESEETDSSSGRSNTPEPTSFEDEKESGVTSKVLDSGKLDQPGWYERVLTLYEKGVINSDEFDDGELETLKRIEFVEEQNDKVWLTVEGRAECNDFREKQLSHARTNAKGIISILTAVTAAVVSIGSALFLAQIVENVAILLAVCGLFLATIYVLSGIVINRSLG